MTSLSLQAFEGHWDLSREIEDRRAGEMAHLEGLCRFDRDGEELIQTETGKLFLSGGRGPFAAERRYLWREIAQTIHVFFEDGRFFHLFDPGAATPMATHDCAPDRYEVAYDFSDWPDWRARWTVVGPRKDYTSVTQYRRCVQPAI